jgi:hypothetical protein
METLEVIEVRKYKGMGRPRTPDYRKKMFRFSRVEDLFKKNLSKFDEKHQRIVLEILEQLKY